jgi:signal transduction histidine kinase
MCLITCAKRNQEVSPVCSLWHNGIGKAPDNIAKLLNISEVLITTGTADETGTISGLLLCKEFAEKHGGKIRIENEAGQGRYFIFTIPVFIEHENEI